MNSRNSRFINRNVSRKLGKQASIGHSLDICTMLALAAYTIIVVQ